MAEKNETQQKKGNYKVACFGCDYWYDCKYYRNRTWVWWIFQHPEEGCPALKYTYDSIFYAIELEKKKREEEAMRKSIGVPFFKQTAGELEELAEATKDIKNGN